MKKLALILLTTLGLYAVEPYIGMGSSISQWTQQEDGITNCRIGADFIGGIKLDKNYSIEIRSNQGLSNDFSTLDIYLKPQINDYLYAIVGYGKTFYTEIDDIKGLRAGVGIEYQRDVHTSFFVDAIRKHAEDDYILTVGYRYYFN